MATSEHICDDFAAEPPWSAAACCRCGRVQPAACGTEQDQVTSAAHFPLADAAPLLHTNPQQAAAPNSGSRLPHSTVLRIFGSGSAGLGLAALNLHRGFVMQRENVHKLANDLERAMHIATFGSQGYPQLFRELLNADLTVIMPCYPTVEGNLHATRGDRVNVILWRSGGTEMIPVFTSPERATEAIAAIGRARQPSCLAQLHGDSLFKILQSYGKMVVINPACACPEMRLPPAAVSRLADRSILRPCDEAEKTDGCAAIVHPEDYPVALMKPVFHFLVGRPDVQAAWLLRMRPEEAVNAGLYVFAVLAIDEGEELEADLMIVLDNAGTGNVSCGMTMLDPRLPSHAALIAEAAPFYTASGFRFPGDTGQAD